MYFGGGMIPTFLLIVKLGLYDSPLSQIIPSCFSIWNIILIKAYSLASYSFREPSTIPLMKYFWKNGYVHNTGSDVNMIIAYFNCAFWVP